MKKKLPIGIQTFRDIRNPADNYIYIDKTAIALELVQNGRYYFLSRPRRFGKSLFLDTLSEIFKGSKELFKGLEIYSNWDWGDVCPVIRISFGVGGFYSRAETASIINLILRSNCSDHGIEVGEEYTVHPGKHFQAVIKALSEKYGSKVAVLIDEYDKPILDNIHKDDKGPAEDAREILREFYSAIKDSDEHIRFVFITGVSKFSKLNLFSGLNNLMDITLQKKYATIAGYTHSDIGNHFADYLEGTDLEKVRSWYNGYNYFGEPIYNPFDILLFFANSCEFKNYWWETGNPAFLIEMLKKKNCYLPELENMVVSAETLSSFDVESIDIVALLWQTGYLTFDSTIHEAGFTSYKMKVPNLEVMQSLNTLFTGYLTGLEARLTMKQLQCVRAIVAADMPRLEQSLRVLFSSIAHNNYAGSPIASYEGYYASVIYTFLSSLGFDAAAEDATNIGRIDLALKAENAAFIFEFKVDAPAEAAMLQIKEKAYYEKYTGRGKPVYLIGIHFCSKLRNISSFEWETAPGG
jgi:hypothetical protein